MHAIDQSESSIPEICVITVQNIHKLNFKRIVHPDHLLTLKMSQACMSTKEDILKNVGNRGSRGLMDRELDL